MVDIPLIEESGDLKMDYGISLMGIHGTVSYGLTDMIAIQAYGNINVLTRYDLQGAIGIYKWFEESLTGLELYGGYGYGNSLFGTPYYAPTGDYHTVFTQINIGKVEAGAIDVDFGMGLKSGFMFSNFFVPIDLMPIHRKNGLFFEPSVFFRFWVGDVKYSIKANYVFPVTIDKRYSIFYPFNFGISRQF